MGRRADARQLVQVALDLMRSAQTWAWSGFVAGSPAARGGRPRRGGLPYRAAGGGGGFVERRQQVEGDIGGLVVARVGARNVVAQRAERRFARKAAAARVPGQRGCVPSGHKPVAMDST